MESRLPALHLSYENMLFTTKSYEFLASERAIWYILYYRGERNVTVVNNIDENWISLEEAAKHLGVTKTASVTGSRRLIFLLTK